MTRSLAPCQPQALAHLPALSTRAAAWVRLVDRATAAMLADADAEEPGEYTQRAAATWWSAVYQDSHSLTSNERIHATAYLWLRDRMNPLPTRDERAAMGWGRCLCIHCRYLRLTVSYRVPVERIPQVARSA